MATGLHNVSSALLSDLTFRQVAGFPLDSRDIQRFWSKVERGVGCWPWIGARYKRGYGMFAVVLPGGEGKQKTFSAHRVAWVLGNGRVVPAHLSVLHQCDNRPCCNPDHLFLGCQTTNMRDASRKGRLSYGPRIEAELTAAQIDEIGRRLDIGAIQIDLAKELGVSKSVISLLARCRRLGLVPRKIAVEA